MYTDAEKIVIYLTPFVINVNLKILMYEFGKDYHIQQKDFIINPSLINTSNLNTTTSGSDIVDICVLYKGTHYDLIYNKDDIILKNKEVTEFYKNKDEKFNYITQNLMESYKYIKSKNNQNIHIDNLLLVSYTDKMYDSKFLF